MSHPRRHVDRVAVVVPAHNEVELLPACLRALRAAAHHSPVPVEIIVVADDCSDGTEHLTAPEHLHLSLHQRTLSVEFRNVGTARAAGVMAALAQAGPGGLWLLTTDADTRVPANWIRRHLAHAARGVDLVAGTVIPADWAGWPPTLAKRYQRRYDRIAGTAGHDHVHGANLGVGAGAYLAAGGFPAAETGEDVALVAAARAARLTVEFALDVAVLTSTRATARAPQGFSHHLRLLAEESPG